MHMMRLKRRQWALVVTVIALSVGSGGVLTQAQQGPPPAGPCVRPQGLLTSHDRETIGRIFLRRAKERLGLSDQQAEQIRSLLQSQRDQARADIQTLCEARVELRQLLARQDSDPAALKATAERIKSIQGKLLDRRLDTMIGLRSQLSPDQWAKWLELRQAKGHRWMSRGRRFAS